jgi:hypothetical protein
MTGGAHSGQRCLRLVRTADAKGETGVNDNLRSPPKPLRGGIDFWYKAVSADSAQLHVYAIPMGAEGIENTDAPRATFGVPQEHIGDGQWHHARLKYDFTKNAQAKDVHFAARIVGRAGELLLDDFAYVPQVGPILRVGKMRLDEDASRPGLRGTLRVAVENAGDVPFDEALVTVALPPGVKAVPPEIRLRRFAPDAKDRVEFTLEGARVESAVLRAVARGGESQATGTLPIRPALEIRNFGPVSPVARCGQPLRIECVLSNPGTVILRRPTATFQLPGGPVVRQAEQLPPGQSLVLSAEFLPPTQSPDVMLGVRATADGVPPTPDAQSHLVVGAATELPLASGKLRAVATGHCAVLENEHVRLAFRRNAFGFGPGELLVSTKSGWQCVAWLPRLSRLAVRPESGQDREHILAAAAPPQAESAGQATLRFEATCPDAACRVRARFALGAGERTVAAEYELIADRALQLLTFEGPLLYALQREEAILPGLEWLVDDELSSDSLDIAAEHSDRLRYIVHPNMITIPAIGIRTPHGTVGLLWDVHQKWDGVRDRPCAVFASPDRFENQRGHVAGLLLPTVPEFLAPNTRRAVKPSVVEAGKTLRLECQLLADAAGQDALAAIDHWVQRFGLPSPAPLPRGSYPAEVQFAMRGYLESLWVPEKREWWTTKGGGGMSQLGRPPQFVADLLAGELLSPDPAVRQRCRQRAEEVVALIGGAARLDAQRFPGRADLRFADPGPPAELLAARAGDGTWRFDADLKAGFPFTGLDYRELGPDEAVEVGTCARKAFEVLRFARIAGDREAYQQMLPTLERMEQFRVPRAAQVWEVPVHTPDVLAAADAVDAYLEAYQFSGDRRWLQAAATWARRGLPFIYLWNDPDKPFLVGASIPVMGATWYQGSWFGRPVQWNGLRYADALLKLAEHDRSYAWRQIAEAVVHSAIQQEDNDGPNTALWPDNFSAIDCQKCPWVFSPQMIMSSMLRLLGRDDEPRTVILGTGEQRLHVSATARLAAASWDGSQLRFQATFPAAEQGVVLVANVGRPAGVLLDGKPIAERPDVEGGAEPGWRYDDAHAYLAIRIARDATTAVRVEGARFRTVPRIPALRTAIDFTFRDSLGGWQPMHQVQDLTLNDGSLAGRIVGGDPYLGRRMLRVRGDDCPVVRIKMRLTAGQGGQLYWSTTDAPGFAEERVLNFGVQADGRMHEYRLEPGRHPGWSGQTITALRLDPGNGAASAEFAVEFVRGGKE